MKKKLNKKQIGEASGGLGFYDSRGKTDPIDPAGANKKDDGSVTKPKKVDAVL